MSRFICTLLVCCWSAHVAAANAATSPANILVFGDSLSAAYGINEEQGWVQLLARRLDREAYKFRVINASVSGETSAGGAARLARSLQVHRPRIVLLELGGNDGLRGLPIATTRGHLEQMIAAARRTGAQVVLLGIKIPPNYGARYGQQFEQMYAELARKHRAALVPFFMEKVALNSELMQRDGIHPNEKAQAQLLENVWPVLRPLLGRSAERPSS